MPDLITHILIVLIIALIVLIIAHIFNFKKTSLIMLGAILPDIFGKVKLINLFIDGAPVWISPFASFAHTLVGSILIGLLIAYLFRYNYFKTAILISLGATTHLLLDWTTKSFAMTAPWNIFWANQYWILLIILFVIFMIVKLFDIKATITNPITAEGGLK